MNMPNLCNHFSVVEHLGLFPVMPINYWLILATNAWVSSTVVSTVCIMVSKNERVTSIYGDYWEKQSPMYIKITTITSAMKESLWSFESLWKASLRNDKSEFRWRKRKNVLGRGNSRYKGLIEGGAWQE